ncbi:hypothetical protein Tco_0263456 [Tanacetum coccineum]
MPPSPSSSPLPPLPSSRHNHRHHREPTTTITPPSSSSSSHHHHHLVTPTPTPQLPPSRVRVVPSNDKGPVWFVLHHKECVGLVFAPRGAAFGSSSQP